MSVGLPIVAALALLALAGGTVWLVVIALDPSGALSRDDWLPVRVVGRAWLVLLLIALLVGAARDLAGPFARAMGRTTATGARRALSREFVGLLLDELWPSSAESRRRAVEDDGAGSQPTCTPSCCPDLRRAGRRCRGPRSARLIRSRSASAARSPMSAPDERAQSVVLDIRPGRRARMAREARRGARARPRRDQARGDADLRNLPLAIQRAALPNRAAGPGQRRPPCRRDDGDRAAHGR